MFKQFTDPSQNFIERRGSPLDAIFRPKSIALVGAKDTEGSVGKTLLHNLMTAGFTGKIYPVNPKRTSVFDLKCYPSLLEIPDSVDLVVIATPAKTVPDIISDAKKIEARGCIVISAGFKELGSEGRFLEEEILKRKGAKMPIIGPNCLGVMNPHSNLNATFARGFAKKGSLAFISQSGAMCTSVLDFSFQQNIGFSAFVSIGSMADVDWGDLIDYVGQDKETESILLYMETVGNARKFLSALREVALDKPVIIIKAGRTEAAAKACASHTGSLAGSDAVFDAAVERVGALRVFSISELFQMASILSKQPRTKGPRLTIVTNAGGPGVLATDAAVLNDLELTSLNRSTLDALNQLLPPAWSHGNPVDILGDADPERFKSALEIIKEDENTDGALVILSPQDMTDPTLSAEKVAECASFSGKPLLASWMGGKSVERGSLILSSSKIPTFEYPDDAAKAFSLMWKYSKNIASLYETPIGHLSLSTKVLTESKEREASRFIKDTSSTLLDESKSKWILSSYGIPVVETLTATTEDEAKEKAQKIGYPVVLKLYSTSITHKTDVGGVKLNLKSDDEVKKAFQEIYQSLKSLGQAEAFSGVTVQKMIRTRGFELILGSSSDPQFGPILLFGSGGELVEVYKDTTLSLPPLNAPLAERMMEKVKIFKALKGVRGRAPIDLERLKKIVTSFSEMISDNPRIKECDINPLLATEEGFFALDARVVLYPKEESNLPKLAIRPYPVEYIQEFEAKDGEKFLILPILPEDEPLLVEFHKKLSLESVRQRFFEFVSLDERTSHSRLLRICFNDFDREIAFVAKPKGKNEVVGAVRISKIRGENEGRMTMIIEDAYHGKGIGKALLKAGIEAAKKEGLEELHASILNENVGMIALCKKFGFTLTDSSQEKVLFARLDLKSSQA